MSELEAVGDAVTGGLVGRAVEPKAGEPGPDGHTQEASCLNCGTPLTGDFCHSCGQHAHVHRTLTAFLHDFLHGVLHFEGKIWNTLPLLAWKPGELTRRYIDGERARFVSPIALFLFSVFLMFGVATLTGGLGSPMTPEMKAELSQEIAADEVELIELRKRRDGAIREGRKSRALDLTIQAKVQEIAAKQHLRSGDVRTDPNFQLDGLPNWLRAPIERAGQNPELLFYKLKTNAYKFSWALIPLSLPFLWLLFPFSRRFRLYDHMVFVTYSLSFMTMLIVTAVLLGVAGLGSIASLLFFVPPFHIYRQLKGAYGLSRSSAILRTLLLTVFAMIALALFGVALIGIGLFD
ncbi:MAG TPA: DUF3667 domain-containing protein [Sphingomicrobium sp.]|nr:DUF3667 domain-containing protein [Sphingomicrobium sp.]